MSMLSAERPDASEPSPGPPSSHPASSQPAAGDPGAAGRAGAPSPRAALDAITTAIGGGALLQEILDAVTDAVFVKDAAGTYVAANEHALRAMGRPASEVLGRTDADLQPAAAAAALRAFDEWVWRTGEAGEREEVVLAADEPRVFVTRKRLLRDRRGAPVALLGVARDVTDRRRAADTTAHLAAIVASSDDAIISKALDGTILTWNASAERLLGWTAREAVGQAITLIIPPELYAEEARIIARITAGERIEHYQTERVRKDGRRLTVSLSVSPVRDRAGRVIMAAKILRDVTTARAAEAERDRLLAAEHAARVEAESMQALLEEQAVELASQAVELEATIDDLRVTNEALLAERSAVERARAASERTGQMLNTIIDQLPAGLYVAEAPSGRLVLHNRRAEEILGHPPRPVATLADYGRYGAEHPDGTRFGPEEYALARVLLRGTPVEQTEIRYRRPDGTVAALSTSAAPVHDADGRMVMAVSMFLDVTARRDAERALAEREVLLGGFFSAPGVMMLVVEALGASDADGYRVVLANPEAAALLGGDPEQVVGRVWASSASPDAAQRRYRTLFARVLATGEPETLHLESSARPGTWLRVSVSPIGHSDEGARRLALLLFDVTAEHAAAEQRRQLQLLVETATDCIVVASPTLRIEYVNAAGLALVGAPSLDALRGASLLDQLDDAARWVMEAEVASAIAAAGRWAGESSLRHHVTGAAILVELTAFAITDPGTGAIIAIACVARPIGERKRLEAELLQAQKMEAVGQLAGGVAHDFNNLLTVITMSADFLLAALPVDDPRREDVLAVATAAERSATLTRQLLAFSRRQVVQLRPFDVNELATGADRMLRRLVGEDVTMQLALSPDVPWAFADPGQVEQALVNLVVNARDAMPTGGTVTIATGVTELGAADVRSHPSVRAGRYVALAVTDTGVGMDAPTMARLFEPFFTTKAVGKGTGLGLSTVRAIVEQARGAVRIRSLPGVGSTFELCLPITDRPGVDAEPAVASDAPGGTETVLIVDDDVLVRAAARRVLTMRGYVVLDAGQYDEAIALARTHPGPIDLLLTDVVLVGPGGRIVADDVRALHPDAAVVFMSGYTADAIVRHRIDAGAPFVEKPFTVASLTARVREALDARHRPPAPGADA